MHTEVSRIYSLLEQTFSGDPWHGPSVMQVLTGVQAAQALARPLPKAHSIWELVLHITAWRNFTIQKLSGHASFDITTPEQDWPRVTHTDEQAWQQALLYLQRSQQQLLELLNGLENVLLDKVVPGRKYTFYVLLHGIIQHDLYHSGQIALLKKQLM